MFSPLADEIDLASKEDVSVIVEFDELPEQVALAVSKELEDDLTEEEARENVEESHEQFKEMGAAKIRALGKKAHVLYDLKYVLSQAESDIRL